MSLYHKTLVAIDPCIKSDALIEKAISITIDKNNITLVHVMELLGALPTAPYAPVVLDTCQIESQVKSAAKKHIQTLLKKHQLNPETYALLSGRTSTEIKNHAADNDFDAIVIGSHGRHGLSLLLGSTSSGVIHGCGCDVLVVKLQD